MCNKLYYLFFSLFFVVLTELTVYPSSAFSFVFDGHANVLLLIHHFIGVKLDGVLKGTHTVNTQLPYTIYVELILSIEFRFHL